LPAYKHAGSYALLRRRASVVPMPDHKIKFG
jgi:hypothetical protein